MEPSADEAKEMRATLQLYLTQIHSLNRQMERDQEEIERLKRDTRALQEKSERLGDETRSLLKSLDSLNLWDWRKAF